MTTKTEQAGPSPSGDNPDNTGGSNLRHQSWTPPPRQSPDPGNETLNLTEEFPLDPLEDLAGALDQDDIDKSAPILTVDLDLPTLRSVAKIGNNRQIKSRRNEALIKGLKTIGKNHLLSAGLATRRLFMAVFPDELELLDNLFSYAQTRKMTGFMGTLGYRLVIDDYQVLLRVLFTRKVVAEDSFRMAGKTPPPLPSWGSDDDLDEYYSANDFEILAVCFRAEVENFLYTLDRYYDFVSGRPRDSNHEVMQVAEEYSQRSRSTSAPVVSQSTQSQVQRAATFIESSNEAPRQPFTRDTSVRFGNFARNNGLPRNNRRMSEILNPMSTIFESPPARGTRMTEEPEETDQMRKMGSQPPSGGRDLPPHISSGRSRNEGRGRASPTGSRAELPRRQGSPNPPDGDPSDSDDGRDSYRRRRWYVPKRHSGNPRGNPNPDDPDPGRGSYNSYNDNSGSAKEAHFGLKLKYEYIQLFDGS
ncbi:hypothetical protein C8R44DRAFT_949411 [Mycena epipterygia]|nr:hypothetical protein C8R44DRAFT_949411 [Mycena epipterygia]